MLLGPIFYILKMVYNVFWRHTNTGKVGHGDLLLMYYGNYVYKNFKNVLQTYLTDLVEIWFLDTWRHRF